MKGRPSESCGIHWFRNDLRLHDNLGLAALADRVDAWLPIFVLDPTILARTRPEAPRLRFMLDCLARLEQSLAARGVRLRVVEGDPAELIPGIAREVGARFVSWNNSATPLGRRRDASVAAALSDCDIESIEVDDHTVFGADEIRTRSGGVYSVYTPYRNEWWRTWERSPRRSPRNVRMPRRPIPGLPSRKRRIDLAAVEGQGPSRLPRGGEEAAKRRLRAFLSGPARSYHLDRDRPDRDGTSRLSAYLRFGAISIRRCFTEALDTIERDPTTRVGLGKWLDELIWREFYNAILVHNPHVLIGSYRPEYDQLNWTGSDAQFQSWCEGQTGYPIVDAGMRQLRATGWMHNRVRMIVASFLTKDLLIDWRRGERFFYESLVDGDPASNNGGWQWSASTGADAQPYFRIFNPVAQGKRFDPDGTYVRRWVPELANIDTRWVHTPWEARDPGLQYVKPIVDHAVARRRALEEFKRVRAIG